MSLDGATQGTSMPIFRLSGTHYWHDPTIGFIGARITVEDESGNSHEIDVPCICGKAFPDRPGFDGDRSIRIEDTDIYIVNHGFTSDPGSDSTYTSGDTLTYSFELNRPTNILKAWQTFSGKVKFLVGDDEITAANYTVRDNGLTVNVSALSSILSTHEDTNGVTVRIDEITISAASGGGTRTYEAREYNGGSDHLVDGGG